MKYALTETLTDPNMWIELLKMKWNEAEFVEFNTLFKYDLLNLELEELKIDLVAEGKRKDKIYASGKFRRYKITDSIKNFVWHKEYLTWKNYQFEDLSLLKNNVEILATITHENYIFISISEQERVFLNEKGYDFGELFELK
ncbi:MAG: hypothetical protein IPN72_15180 [Saprospiraceae bacterium]|nr:hypothetical protein [Saprospiraceae bacterium]